MRVCLPQVVVQGTKSVSITVDIIKYVLDLSLCLQEVFIFLK